MDNKLTLFAMILGIVASVITGCASNGTTNSIPLTGEQSAQNSALMALDAAEQVLLSRGFDPLRVEKENGYMRFVRKVDTGAMREVNIRVVGNESGGSELDVDVVVMRTEPKRKGGLSLGGGFGFGSGSALGVGIGSGTSNREDKAVANEIKSEIANAVETALAGSN